MAETIRNEKEEKKTKAKAPGLTKKDKKHQTSNLHISVTAASAELKFLQESDLDQIYTLLKNQRRRGSRYGDMEVWSFVLFIFFRQTLHLCFSFFLFFFLSYRLSHRIMFEFN